MTPDKTRCRGLSAAATRAFGYSYEANTSLVQQTAVALDNSGNLTATRTYDPQRDLLTGLQTQAGVGTDAATVTQFDYAYE